MTSNQTDTGSSSNHLYFPLGRLTPDESIFSDRENGILNRKYQPILMPVIGKQLAVNTYYANELIAAANTRITIDLLKIFDELKINFKVNRRELSDQERRDSLDAVMAQLIAQKQAFLDQIRPDDIPVIQDNVKAFLDQTLANPKIEALASRLASIAGYIRFANEVIASDERYIGTASAIERLIVNEKNLFKLPGHETGETIEHVVKTTWFSLMLAEALDDFDTADCERLGIICMGHDCGKALLPKQVLYKRGRLTRVESDIIKSHVLLSYILSSGNQAHPNLESFAMALHHVKENPNLPQSYGIAPGGHTTFHPYLTPEARDAFTQIFHDTQKFYRVISIADTFEAISAERVYKRASSVGKTLDIMLKDNEKDYFFHRPYLETFIQVLLEKFVPRHLHFKITNHLLDTVMQDRHLSPSQRTFYKTYYRGVITRSSPSLTQDLEMIIYNRTDKKVIHRLTVPPRFFLDRIFIR